MGAHPRAGVCPLSSGGTKNGMMYGGAVVFFDAALAYDFVFTGKRGEATRHESARRVKVRAARPLHL